MGWEEWKEGIDEAVADVCIQIIKEPLTYFSEADIQQLLVEGLRKKEPLHKLYPTGVHKGKGSKGTYKTSLLHREYGGGGGTRIDIVIFDPEDVKNIDNVNLTQGTNYLNPVYAFELGTEKTSDTAAHVGNDLKKLDRVKENGTGYLVHFYKDVTQAKKGTKSNDATEAKINTVFKEVFAAEKPEQKKQIKVLAILIRTYKDQAKMCGKCEIFNGHAWIKVNVGSDKKIKDAILEQLE